MPFRKARRVLLIVPFRKVRKVIQTMRFRKSRHKTTTTEIPVSDSLVASSQQSSSSNSRSHFSNVAAELLDLISVQIQETNSLLNLARTCWRFYQILEPRLYCSVTIRSKNALRSLHDSLSNAPARAEMVRSFSVHRPMDHYRASHNASTTSELSDFCLLSRLTNLEHLELNTYYLDRDEFHKVFDPASRGEAFRSLKTCKLDDAKSIAIIKEKLLLIHLGVLCFEYFDGTEFQFSIFRSLLFHPTLEVLTIYSVAGGLQPFSSDYKSSTALQRLNLLDSLISPRDLETFLSVPRALKELIVHSSEMHIRPSGYSPKNTGVYGEALEVIGPSLERLVIARDWVLDLVPLQLYRTAALPYLAADMWTWMGCPRSGSGLTNEEPKESSLPTLEVSQDDLWEDDQIIREPIEEFYRDMFNIMSFLDPKMKTMYFHESGEGGLPPGFFETAATEAGISLIRSEGDLEEGQVVDEVVKYRVLRKEFVFSDADLSLPSSCVE